MLVRVAERPHEKRPGFTGLPRWDAAEGLTIDWVPDAEWEPVDARVVRRKADGLVRLTFISHLRVVRCGDGRAVREITNVTFRPQDECEEFGVEDPRITALNGRFYFTYVAVSRHGPATALASTTDFCTFDRHGIIFCPENKDVVLFPEQIGGSYAALHRPVCGTPFTRPEMWVARSPGLAPLGGTRSAEPVGRRMAIRSPWVPVPRRFAFPMAGWKSTTGTAARTRPGEVGTYYGGALLLDATDPARVLKRTAEPFMVPEADFEREGFVPNVVFPTGVVEAGENLLVYYGAADAVTAVAEFEMRELFEALTASG